MGQSGGLLLQSLLTFEAGPRTGSTVLMYQGRCLGPSIDWALSGSMLLALRSSLRPNFDLRTSDLELGLCSSFLFVISVLFVANSLNPTVAAGTHLGRAARCAGVPGRCLGPSIDRWLHAPCSTLLASPLISTFAPRISNLVFAPPSWSPPFPPVQNSSPVAPSAPGHLKAQDFWSFALSLVGPVPSPGSPRNLGEVHSHSPPLRPEKRSAGR